jgi:hypothetical protein
MSGPGDHARTTERTVVRDERERERRLFARILIGQCVAILVLVASVWLTSYQGRVHGSDEARAECVRAKQDRSANAAGWRIAQAAREAEHQPEVAARYDGIARGLEERSQVDCGQAYPAPKLFEFR